ncbi:hypothetical protein [Streptomyces sp. NBC_01304]|uniref:hypothetical protein n=1 Tax=Streptomyces sp. NBC_01304 TaxID=2903818 RepID=UPI002E0F6D35|nr:hypothetical protein OG430_41030 [Streptomyces sp. NBC_01304]
MKSAQPRIRVRIQHPDEPDAYPLHEFLDEDAAAIRAGVKFPYIAEIIDADDKVLTDISNLVADPGHEGIYMQPADIGDPWLAYYSADHWTSECGIQVGALARQRGLIYAVLGFHQVDHEYGDEGYNTGYLICRPATGGRPLLVWVGNLVPVLELP